MSKKVFAFFYLIAVSASTSLFAQNTDSVITKMDVTRSGYSLLFKDDFEKPGNPNSKDWMFRRNVKMGGSSFPGNVTQAKESDGSNANCLLIKFTYDSTQKDALKFKGGGIVSVHNFGYGYYETKVKLYGGKPDFAGLHQSFWSMGLTGTNEAEGAGIRDSFVNEDLIPAENRVLEIDGFEMDSKANSLGQNYHIYTPKHINQGPKPAHFTKEAGTWFTMSYEWLPGKINYYADGELISTLKLENEWLLYAPQNVWFTALPVDVKGWGGLKIPPANSAMQVDYFKFYAKHLPGINRMGNSDFEYKVLGGNSSYPVAWIVSSKNGNDSTAVKVLTDSSNAHSGKRFISIKSEKKYQSSLKQIVEYIPDGVYNFSVYVKSSGTQKKAEIVLSTGKEKKTIKIKKSKEWYKVLLPKVQVKNNQAIVDFQVSGSDEDWLFIDDLNFSETNL